MRVLLVEDDRELGAAVVRYLREQNCVVDLAENGEDGLHLGATEIYDVAILDLGLPKIDGLSVLRSWRERERHLPVLILTARDVWTDKILGFKAGADDYLTKPFRVEELLMRLRALTRRAAGHGANRITCGPITFDAQLGSFELGGLPMKLTGLEWRVLEALILRDQKVLPRAELIERVYDGDAEVDSNSVEVIITRLRRKIGTARIEAERGRGYRLVADQP